MRRSHEREEMSQRMVRVMLMGEGLEMDWVR